MNVCLSNYNNKADALHRILENAGHRVGTVIEGADLYLVDTDIPSYGDRRDLIRAANSRGVPVVLYHHGGDFRWEYDGCISTDGLDVAMHLVPGPAHKRVMEGFGYHRRVEVTGWYFSPVLPFKPNSGPRRILFAPRHPWADGRTTPDTVRVANERAFAAFMAIPGEHTVRYIGRMEPNGILHTTAIKFVRGQPDNNYMDILKADLVISNETYGAMAVALGVPTVMYDQDNVCHIELLGDEGVWPATWGKYREEIRYPYDLDDHGAVEAACSGGPVLEAWRDGMIGPQMDPGHFIGLLESCLT